MGAEQATRALLKTTAGNNKNHNHRLIIDWRNVAVGHLVATLNGASQPSPAI
jgi:hypothetical protein